MTTSILSPLSRLFGLAPAFPQSARFSTGTALKTFRELYCARFNLSGDRFESDVAWHALHWPAKLVWWWRWVNPDFFAPDFELIRAASALTRRRDFWDVADDFLHHPCNQGLFRKTLRLRISPSHLSRIFERELSRE